MWRIKLPALAALAGVGLEPGLFAATEIPNGSHFSQLGWNWNPWILASLMLALIAYVWGLLRMKGGARARVFGAARCAAFGAGLTTLFAVLITPLDALDDQLFTAHMMQHLVLMMVAPPLLILGRPGIAFLWAFPLGTRCLLGRAWVKAGLGRAMHAVMSPLVVWILCSAALWFWHLPSPYGWALASEFVHALEHVCFFVTSLMFWSLVLPVGHRRLDYGTTMLFVGTFGVQNGFLGALLTFAGRPLYIAHLHTTAAWGLTPLEDQQLAGLLMWIPASLIHLGTLGVLFIAWLRAADRRAIGVVGIRATASRKAVLHCVWIVLAAVTGLSGCGQSQGTSPWRVAGASASRGRELIQTYGCGSCHTIPGAPRATGNAGPPLGEFGRRTYIAGMLRNTPENLVRWLREPQSVVPGNAMVNMGVTEQDARDLAAYLYALPGAGAAVR